MKRFRNTGPFWALAVFIFVSLACGGTPSPTAVSITQQTPLEIALLPSPLENVEFSTQVIAYPTDWPTELRYPEQFSVVEVSSGTLPDNASIGWSAKLRYAGDPESAANILSSFLTEKGWQIVEQAGLDSGGVLMVIKKDGKSNGIVVIDTDASNPNYTNIIATIFP